MKKFFITSLAFITAIGIKAQVEIDTTSNIIYLDQVYKVEGASKELKKKAFQWVAQSYNNSNYVTRVNTDDNIIAKGSFKVDGKNYLDSTKDAEDVDYTLDIKFKDGRYRIEIKNVTSNEIKMALMSESEYQSFLINFYEAYRGVGKISALKKAKNSKYIAKNYQVMLKYTKPVLESVKLNIQAINSSLLNHMKKVSKKDDW